MRKFFNKYIIGLIVFYAFWMVGIPFVFSKAVPVVCENISVNSDYKVEIIEPKLFLGVLPKAKFYANKIEIREKSTNDYTLVNDFQITARLLPLLSGKFHINAVDISSLTVNSTIRKDIELDKDFFNKIKKTKVCCDKFSLDEFSISLWQKDVKNPIIYTGKDLFFEKRTGYLKLNLDSKIDINNSVSTAKAKLYLPKNNNVHKSIIDIKVDNFNIEPLGDYLRQYLPTDFKDLKGVVNLDVNNSNLKAEINDFKAVMNDDAKSIIFPKNLNISSNFNITNKVINFENVDIKSETIHTILSGNIYNFLESTLTTLDLNVQIDNSKVEDIVCLLPPIVVEEFNVYKLKKYKFYGDVIGNFSIKGDIKEPDVFGDIYISNGILISPIKNANGAIVKINFAGNYLNFDVTVPAGGLERVWVKGGVELYNVKYSDMRVWSTKHVDLETAESKVIPIHEILNFVIGPVPIMDVKGNGNIDITVKGNRANPHVWGNLNFYNVKTYFNEIPNLVLEQGEAILTFNDENAVFKTKKGTVNGQKFDIFGTCTLQGKFDFDVKSLNQDIGKLYYALKTSTMIPEIQEILPKLDICKGPSNLSLKVFGEVKDIEDLKFNQNFSVKGDLELLGGAFGMQGISIHNTRGNIAIEGLNANADLNSYIGNSQLYAKADIKDNIANVNVNIPKLNLSELVPAKYNFKNEIGDIFLRVESKYKGKINEIEYDKVDFIAKVLSCGSKNNLNLSNGEIKLKNNKLNISNLKGNFIDGQNSFDINLSANNAISNDPKFNGNIQLKNFDLKNINLISNLSLLPVEIKKYLNLVSFNNGKINLNCHINNNKINGSTNIGGLSFIYTPMKMPIKVVNGTLVMRNNSLQLNKINLLADEMPILVDGEVADVFSSQKFKLYFNSKPKQDFIDKYINRNQLYPVKIKGDIVYSARFKGDINDFELKSDVHMSKDSSIYHLGATVGDVENSIVMNLDARILKQNLLRIKEFSYDKVISSQSGRETQLNMLKARGGIDVYKDDLVFHDLYIKTQNPTDARIFNIIFRKPNIKQGQFTSDLKFNGKLSNPKLSGSFHIFETNIPFLDTTMKNITFLFKDRVIELSSFGEILGNDISIKATLKNKLVPPYYVEKAHLKTDLLDLNYITNKLKLSQVDNSSTFESFEGFDLNSVIIKNLELNANSIHLRNIVAENFSANTSLNEKRIFNVNHFKFNIANGVLTGKSYYNLNNNKTGLNVKAKDIDANALSYAIFDLNNQIYGDLTGDINLSCSGNSFENCMKTLNGDTTFDVIDGRMPKLGSLEYLLRAGNIIKGGITGFSLNSVIDVITPMKTGSFSNIHGDIKIKKGVAENIEITTKGENLSLFINGNYNFSTSNAEMEVFGMLSKKISTMFGPIGNISLNSLFNSIPGIDLSKNSQILENINKIPGIELSSKAYRRFIAEISGNINGEDYVTSFKWIN